MFAWFLSEKEASDISVALSCGDVCPEALRILWRAMAHVSREVWPLASHPLFHTNKAPAPIKAYGILARAAARVAADFWIEQNRLAAVRVEVER